ncbi:hypothetical protein [Clostridium ljungdahlii]|uniref:Uncharacterized protein n=1 Tax=Clostridium ljungdahlii TaxID=1538 RepID=A0A168MNR6_9CLOT|nr:hypothetical protein [Clostridium ljungdahlii]OAA84951.1 hypothetical protein WY13_02854 [Clostridium ljungdahlii]
MESLGNKNLLNMLPAFSHVIKSEGMLIIDEFRGNDGSLINRFSDERPREAQNIEKMYTSGVFGGKPVYENE